LLGFIFHLIMVILAIIALTTAFSFLVRNRDKFRSFVLFIPFFGVFTAFICGGYGILGIYPDLTSAYIPRFFGFWGVIGFLLTELSYGVMDMNYPKPVIYGVIGSTTLYGLFDMILNEGKDTVVFIRHDYYTSFEKSPSNHLLFHLIFLLVIGAALIVLSTIWYKSKKTAVEKDFASKIILSNYVLLITGLHYAFRTNFVQKYPAFLFSLGFAFVYFMWLRAIKKRVSLLVDAQNISQEIFSTIEVPVIIISVDGKLALSNPCAKEVLNIQDEKSSTLRDLFLMSDVDELRLLSKARKGENYQFKVRIKASDTGCMLKCAVKLDYTGAPFCIICTVLSLTKEFEDEKGNL